MERLTIRNSDGSVSQPTWLNWVDALERLAAYENTGLEPCETNEKYATIMALNRLQLKISLARLCEILQAETEGRCVVLPCKVGDTVYRVVTPTPGTPLLSEMKITTMKQDASLVNLVGKHKLVSYYLTREEAEAALREAEG